MFCSNKVFRSSGGTCPRLVLSLEACSVCSSLALLVLGRRFLLSDRRGCSLEGRLRAVFGGVLS